MSALSGSDVSSVEGCHIPHVSKDSVAKKGSNYNPSVGDVTLSLASLESCSRDGGARSTEPGRYERRGELFPFYTAEATRLPCKSMPNAGGR